MNRQPPAQMDFEALSVPVRRVLTVAELTGRIRRLLETELGAVWVMGEVTNLRTQGSGHIYFTLKDASAQLNCVLFRSEPVGHRDCLEDGQKLLLQGELTVYEPRGQYQLIVRAIEPQGVGALQIAFERLKRKLEAEGLFAPERKRPLPRFARRIGVVTSPTGAALRDVLHVIARRHAALEVVLAPCRVQGEGAALEIAAAIRLLNQWNQIASPEQRLDLILVTRGGGSLEDLWAFNEEVVARAIFESALVVVSAVGHEIDFTISDFAADVRAATPSAAAEIITEGMHASRRAVIELRRRLSQLATSWLELFQNNWRQLAQRLARLHPRRRLQEQSQHLDELQSSMLRCVRQGWRRQFTAWQHLRQRLSRLKPALFLGQRRQEVHDLTRRLQQRMRALLEDRRHALANLQARLQLLGPENVLARGYSITLDESSGAIIVDETQTQPGQALRTRLKSGEVRSVVKPKA